MKGQPFCNNFVWCLAIHIDKKEIVVFIKRVILIKIFVNCNQVKFCLSVFISATISKVFQNYCAARNQKFFTATCIFYMDSFQLSFDFYMGNKTVWSVFKNSFNDFFVTHRGILQEKKGNVLLFLQFKRSVYFMCDRFLFLPM